jgi:hypothetical protein
MVTRTNRTAVAVTLITWLFAVGSAAAVTYVVKGPPVPRAEAFRVEQAPVPARVAPLAKAALPQAEAASVLVIPTLTLIGAFHRPEVAVPTRVAQDIPDMQCASWRELDMGSGRVKVCEETR